jgi:hypothetical protein
VGLRFARQLGRLLHNLDHKLNILQLQAASWYLKETKKKVTIHPVITQIHSGI